MPNWCSNTTYVFGKTSNVKPFLDPIKEKIESLDEDSYADFISIHYPCPQELRDSTANFVNINNPIPENWLNLVAEGTWTQEDYDSRVAETLADVERKKILIEKYGAKDWYDWCIAHWGTKWGACDLYLGFTDNSNDTTEIELRYETAWGPALEAIEYISEKFPKLIFSTFYREEGMGFQGYHKVAGGDVLNNESAEFIPSAEDYDYIMDGMDEQELDGLIN